MEFPYTPESEQQKRAAEISANLKHIHDTVRAYCQTCWVEYGECPGHPDNPALYQGPFYLQLLKERTLLREVVADHPFDQDTQEALSALETVFDRYHLRMEYENRVGTPTGDILKEFDEVQEDWMRTIPLQLGDPARKQGYTHTKVEGDQLSTEEWVSNEEFVRRKYYPGPLTDPELTAANARLNGIREVAEEEFEAADARAIFNHYLDSTPQWYISEEAKQWAEVRMEEGYFDVADKPVDEGIKHDEGKDRWDLLPPSIQKVVEVYTIGARKYDDDNWAKGLGYRRIFGAMMRHAWKWFWGERIDQQDRQHHLASVAWACLTLMHYEDEGVGTDDRAFKPLDREVPPPAYELTGWDASADFQGPNDEPVYEAKPYGFEVTKHPDGTTTVKPVGH